MAPRTSRPGNTEANREASGTWAGKFAISSAPNAQGLETT